MTQSSWKLIFKGVVQGVGFRPTIYRVAHQFGSNGYVLNKGSEVEVVIDTDPTEFIEEVRRSLPSLASITSVEKTRETRKFNDFNIHKSKDGERHSLIPVDTAICADCVQELFKKDDRRYQFSFTNCTVCGARFSAITNVPYDRVKTSMKPFPLCKNCQSEYTDPLDRRYHAQTISCPVCGPRYILYNTDGRAIETQQPIQRFAHLLDTGAIGVVKSWGGMHLSCSLDQIDRFRQWYKRPQKAFAVMVKSIEAATKYAHITSEEKKLLLSSSRPIVLVKKTIDDSIAPGLDRIGLFLPYTGLHHLLFSFLDKPALIMTSANIPGEPMITKNKETFSLHADAYLLHNRDIPNRVDDTVIKIWRNHCFFLRKARGFVPDPLSVSHSSTIASVGAGENVYGSLSTEKKLYLTQYIGNSRSYAALSFLEESLRHLMRLTMKKPSLDAVAMDLHPAYETRIVAERFADEFDVPLYKIQHHWAHSVSLLVDHNIDEGIVLSLDGLGFGDDGTLWGGEVIHCDVRSYHRVGHLKPIPLLGGDKATQDPRRLVFALLDTFDKEKYFTGEQAEIFRRLLRHAPVTSSFARILDALSCYLGICEQRTYEGEPAMKLEQYLAKGKPTFTFDVMVDHGVIDTPHLFNQIDEKIGRNISEKLKADIAYSFVQSIINALTDVAIEHAKKHTIFNIGVTGGVSYNIPIVEMIHERLKNQGYSLFVHNNVPNGDGGIAIGQNSIASHMISPDK